MLRSGGVFLRHFIRDPRGTGAVAPATASLANGVAREAHQARQRHSECLQIVELGAGTGALTRAISPLGPVLVEKDPGWADLLRHEFPALEVRNECATQTLRALAQPVGIVSSIPLLNNPQSAELKRLIAEKYVAGYVKFCVLYTYGWSDPFSDALAFAERRRARFVARSIPPAHVWVYQ